MKGLILKDLLLSKNNAKTMLLIVLAFGIMSFAMEGFSVSAFIPMIAVMFCITTFSYDEFNKCDAYTISLPTDRRTIVRSKYIYTILIVLISTLLGMAISIVVELLKSNLHLGAIFSELAGVIFGVMFFISLMYPLIYKFGSQKSRMLIFVVIAIIFLGVSGISTFLNASNFNIPPTINSFFNSYGIYLLILAGLLVIYISYRISCRIYTKKEF